jgi:DNA-binding NarL/FixJ family response regulator
MSKVRILVVENNRFWRELISAVLRNNPTFEIICEVVDGLQAVLMAEKLQPTIVLMDISMPRLGGIDAARWIRKLAPDSRIVFLSVERDFEVVQAALNIACGYVLKSDAATDLVRAIDSAAVGKSFISQQLQGRSLVGNCE